jgi:phospholipase/carboxylesterase
LGRVGGFLFRFWQIQWTTLTAGDQKYRDSRQKQLDPEPPGAPVFDSNHILLSVVRADTLYAMNTNESAIKSSDIQPELPALETVELNSGPEPSASIIWLHGLGADGHDFEPMVPQISWPGAPDIRYIFPHAPVRPVTLNGGMPMRAWYDILSIDSHRDHDQLGIVGSVNQAADLVNREIDRGIPPERIVLAGFSQGGAIALQLALRYPKRLAGLIALSTYLLFSDRLERQAHTANRGLPVFAGHGTMDPMVPFSMGESLARTLESIGHPVEWHSYPMQHAVCPQEISDITAWLKGRLTENTD